MIPEGLILQAIANQEHPVFQLITIIQATIQPRDVELHRVADQVHIVLPVQPHNPLIRGLPHQEVLRVIAEDQAEVRVIHLVVHPVVPLTLHQVLPDHPAEVILLQVLAPVQVQVQVEVQDLALAVHPPLQVVGTKA